MKNKNTIFENKWGREIIWAKTERYLGKILSVKSSERTSRQYHKYKDKTIYILYGTLSLELGSDPVKEIKLKSGEAHRILPGTIYSFSAKWGDVDLIEVSSPETGDYTKVENEFK